MILVDSDVLIWVLRNNLEFKNKFIKATEISNGQVFITPIQHMEIISGMRVSENLNTNLFLNSLNTVIINKEIGKMAGQFLSRYKKSHNILNADAIVAATAKYYDLFLWTNNKKHFPMIQKNEFYSAKE